MLSSLWLAVSAIDLLWGLVFVESEIRKDVRSYWTLLWIVKKPFPSLRDGRKGVWFSSPLKRFRLHFEFPPHIANKRPLVLPFEGYKKKKEQRVKERDSGKEWSFSKILGSAKLACDWKVHLISITMIPFDLYVFLISIEIPVSVFDSFWLMCLS